MERVRWRVEEKQLPCVRVGGETMIPAIPLRDFYYDHLLKVKKSPGTLSSKAAPRASNAPNESRKGPFRETFAKNDEWVSSAFRAGKLVGMSAYDMHRLGIQGKVRTKKEGKWTYYNRSDVEALKQPTVPPNVPENSSEPRGVVDESPATPTESSAPKASGTDGGGEDADVAARTGGAAIDQEFHGETIEKAVSAAAEALGLQKEEVAFDVIDRGSMGFLGVGGRHARIKLRAVALSEKQGPESRGGEGAEESSGPKELASVKGIVDLAPHQVLERAQAFLTHWGYRPKFRTGNSVLAERPQPSPAPSGKPPHLSVEVLPQPEGGVRVVVTGDDQDGFLRRQFEWAGWAEGLPKKATRESANPPAADTAQTTRQDRIPSGATELRNNTLYYSQEQAVQKLGLSAEEVEAMTWSGELQAVRVGGKRLFAAKAVNLLAEKRAEGPSGEPDAVWTSAENEGRSTVGGPQTEAHFYNLRQAAEMLRVGVSEVGRLVSQGDLPVEWIDRQIWYPAQPLEDLVRRKFGPDDLVWAPSPRLVVRAPGRQQSGVSDRGATLWETGEDPPSPKSEPTSDKRALYYTVDEVTHKLGRPHHEIWGMAFSGKLCAEIVGDQRLFLKRSVDDLIKGRRSVAGAGTGPTGAPEPEERARSKPNEAGGYYTVQEVARKLGKEDVDDVWHMLYVGQLKIKMEKVRGQRLFPRHEVDALLVEAEGAQTQQGVGVVEAAGAGLESDVPAGQGNRDEDPEASLDFYYTPAQAARILGRSFYGSNRKALPTIVADDLIWIQAKVVDDLAKSKHGGRKPPNSPVPRAIRVPNDAPAGDDTGTLAAELQYLKEENERLKGELELEREGRFDDMQHAQDEIDQLKAELDDNREGGGERTEDFATELEDERALRVESEQWVRDLQAELDEERERRLALEESIRSSGPGGYEREGYEERLAALGFRLGEEERRRLQGEEQIRGLRARLEEGEATIGAMREAASSEKEKARLLEEKGRLLDEVRRLLGSVEGPSPPVLAVEGTSAGASKLAAEETVGELLLRTPFGQVPFLPPFPLSEQDEKLLRLVAREDDLTAEQIRKYTGRRRAAGELEDLLDRLADEGVKDLVVEVDEDRYRFNPAALQND